MSLIGKTLGHYSVSALIGRGGMGEVYRAKDSKLGRDVAIKVLPEEFAKDADRVARFQREAKLLASLNHPNIAAIYGLEESGGTNFLVLELVEGQTLAEVIAGSALGARASSPALLQETLKIALQIAEALEAAHEKGVIHRDLKPANIKVTPEGKVKVLDFGLAKAFAGEQENLNLSNSPTLSNAATQQGVILGTAAYMSPEQAKGRAVDKRTDIWAFGAVLFEMLTSKPAFAGDDVSEILASVIKGDVKLDLLPANINSRIREVIARCLQKDLKRRYPGIADAQYEIEQALADSGGLLAEAGRTAKPGMKVRATLSWIGAVIICSILAGAIVWKLRAPEPPRVMRFECELPDAQPYGNLRTPSIAVSPDGRQFVYAAGEGLYLYTVGELSPKLLAGTEGKYQLPAFSSDSKWIAYNYMADRKLKKVSVNGGSPVALCDVKQVHGLSWAADNRIVYCQVPESIMRVSADGGTPEILNKAQARDPQVLPDGKSLLYVAGTEATETKIVVQSLESGESKELFAGAWARYLPAGYIVYRLQRNNSVYAIPFDLDRLETTGGAVSVLEGVEQAAFSDSGTMVYMPAAANTALPERTLVWVDRNGKEELIAAPPKAYAYPRISPDGKRLALTVGNEENADIWIWDMIPKNPMRLTFDKGLVTTPIWSSDGKQIAFASNREGSWALYRKEADGTGEIEKLSKSDMRSIISLSWSSDEKTLVFEQNFPETRFGIVTMSLEGDRTVKPLLQEKLAEVTPQISPDGRWMAYVTVGSRGGFEVFVRPFPNVNSGKWQVSTNGGTEPRWSRERQELFYRDGDSMMSVGVETEPAFKPGLPREIFHGKYFANIAGHGWDISPDGKRFLMIKPPESATSASETPKKIIVVLNWLEELKQKVPAK